MHCTSKGTQTCLLFCESNGCQVVCGCTCFQMATFSSLSLSSLFKGLLICLIMGMTSLTVTSVFAFDTKNKTEIYVLLFFVVGTSNGHCQIAICCIFGFTGIHINPKTFYSLLDACEHLLQIFFVCFNKGDIVNKSQATESAII